MTEGGEERLDFLRRWSRLKAEARTGTPAQAGHEAADAAPPAAAATPPAPHTDEAPVLPPVESLGLESDYRLFFHPKVAEGVRRAALKKLFSDPHFNMMDGLDVYIDDYTQSEPLTEAMLGQLEQAKKILAWSREDAEARARAELSEKQQGAENSPPLPAETSPGEEAPGAATTQVAAAEPARRGQAE